ncbi:MAG: hypothetical protein Q7S51_11750 [Gallionellaceae bacterium]|nr:hypothetical protein [Gallionellaceae bacterium]
MQYATKKKGQVMIKIQIELPDATAQAAQAAGLLTPQALDRLLSNALRRQQAVNYLMRSSSAVSLKVRPRPVAK